MVQSAVEVLLPSPWEIEVAVVASVFLIASYWLFAYRGGGDDDVGGVGFDRSRLMQNLDSGEDKIAQLRGDTQTNAAYIIKVELLAAKNLIGANLNGTSDPYAIVNCGSEKRFSSMVPGSRNPMWGEEFNFPTDELPVKAELRERTEQYSQLWHGCQRQFTEMERLHWHTVQMLQFQLANVREGGDPKTNSNDASQIIHNIGNQFEAHGNSSENVNVNVHSNGKNADNISSFISSDDRATQVHALKAS